MPVLDEKGTSAWIIFHGFHPLVCPVLFIARSEFYSFNLCKEEELGDNTYTTSDESPFYQAQESNKLKHLSFVLSLHWFSAQVGHKCNQILVPDV